jgi:hypothetical protein
MTRGPDFDEFVGVALDVGERERLRSVHEQLVAAGPPPELPEELGETPQPRDARVIPHRRRLTLALLAAALGLAAFGIGFLVGDRSANPTPDRVVAMTGSSAAPAARASLTLFAADDAGNWPMELTVRGLAPAKGGKPYELWLTKGERLAALCGSFRVHGEKTVVPMNAPYMLKGFDGWVVVVEGSSEPLLTT